MGVSSGRDGGPEVGWSYLLRDEESDHEDRDGANDGEHDDDTGLPRGEVGALGNLGDGNLAASDKGHVDGGHCDCF